MRARAQVVGVCGKAGSREGGSSFDIAFFLAAMALPDSISVEASVI